jgi:arabinose-5-phosphate isomerase
VALMERKGFNADRYRELHPGGSLGRRLVRVSDIMHGKDALPLVAPDTPMKNVLPAMTAASFGVAGVVDKKGALIGIITDGDLRRHIDGALLELSAEKVMTKNPKTIGAATLAVEALATMNAAKITSLFVVGKDDAAKQPVGLIHIHDCLRAGIR